MQVIKKIWKASLAFIGFGIPPEMYNRVDYLEYIEIYHGRVYLIMYSDGSDACYIITNTGYWSEEVV